MSIARREFLSQAVLGAAALSAARLPLLADTPQLGIPGPFRGRVVGVNHPGSIISGQYQAEPVQQMMDKGMMELTGARSAVEAWRFFFQPGDVVAIKLNPVGRPHVISAPPVVQAIVAGLKSAGVKTGDIIAYDRYRREFLGAGFDKWLPDGVRWAAATQENPPYFQLDMDGYDADQYMEMSLLLPRAPADDRHYRRSYVAKLLTQQVNKVVNLCLLKHHQSAGVTIALKNMSHGFVNNVSRSHGTATLNACGSFIPAVVDLPVFRQKMVLHICDGIKAGYHGGPSQKIGKYTWEHKTMYFATDPVALDKTGWKAIDAKRAEVGMLPIALAKPDPDSTFLNMQPEHIEIAGAMGLGEFDDTKIDLRKFSL